MITDLLKRAYVADVELWTESGKLKYRAPEGALTEALKREIVEYKESLIRRLEHIQTAKGEQWVVFEFGEMYSKRLGLNSELCIFRSDDESFTTWKGNWKSDDPKPYKETILAAGVSFKEALDRANNYLNWSTGRKPAKGGKQWSR